MSEEQRQLVSIITKRGLVSEQQAETTVKNLAKESIDSVAKMEFFVKDSVAGRNSIDEKYDALRDIIKPVSGSEYNIVPRSIAVELVNHFEKGKKSINDHLCTTYSG